MLLDLFSRVDFHWVSFYFGELVCWFYILFLLVLCCFYYWFDRFFRGIQNFLIGLFSKKTSSRFFSNFKFVYLFCGGLFFLLLRLNFLGLFPYIGGPTSHMTVTLSFSLVLWLMVFFSSFLYGGFRFFSHFIPFGRPL